MSEFLGSIWWLAVSLGVLVTFHEFGHYWVARRCGVRVLRFSIGFGAPLWKRVARDGTEYVIAAIPLGGYVKMLDERENMVPTSELPYAFNRKPVWQRIAIVAAGPVANLVLCVALLWAMFVIGRPDYAPVVGHVEGVAQASGLQAGDMVLAVGKRETRSWTDIQVALLPYALDRHDALLRVQRGNLEIERSLRLSTLPKDVDERRLLDAMGLEGRHVQLPARVGKVEPGTPADGVLQSDDLVLSIDGMRITRWSDISPAVEALGKRGGTGVVEVKRKGQNVALDLAPRLMQTPGRPVPAWVLGVTPATPGEPAHDAVLRYGPAAAVPAAFREAAQNAHDLVSMIGRAFTGRVELRNTVAGPVTIGRTANYFASQGVAAYLSILALLSLSLGVMNLLPIPILDGGHLLYYLIELVKGSPVSERAMAAGQYIGLALIAGLMGLAFYNDIVNNLLH